VDGILDEESEIRTFSLFRASLHSQMTLSRPVGMAVGLHIVSVSKNVNVSDILFKIFLSLVPRCGKKSLKID
jgi:hypothetical protein